MSISNWFPKDIFSCYHPEFIIYTPCSLKDLLTSFILSSTFSTCYTNSLIHHHLDKKCYYLNIKNHNSIKTPMSTLLECNPGYIGENCSLTCRSGYFGRGCNEHCHCSQDEYCDPVRGCLCNSTSDNCREPGRSLNKVKNTFPFNEKSYFFIDELLWHLNQVLHIL